MMCVYLYIYVLMYMKDKWMDVKLDGCNVMSVCMYTCMMYVCMYVCTYVKQVKEGSYHSVLNNIAVGKGTSRINSEWTISEARHSAASGSFIYLSRCRCQLPPTVVALMSPTRVLHINPAKKHLIS